MRTMFVSTHLPHAGIPQAGHYIAHQKLLEYISQGPVYLVSISNTWEQRFSLEFPIESMVVHLSNRQRYMNVMRSMQLPLRVSNRYSKLIHEQVIRQAEMFCPDQIHYEYTASAAYYVPGVKSIWKEQDITFESLARRSQPEKSYLRRLFFMIESSRMRKWEISCAKTMDSIITVTRRDKENLVANGVDSTKITVETPNGVAYVDESVVRVKHNILFFGAFNRFENRASLIWFLEHVFPHILNTCPLCKLHVIGGGADADGFKVAKKYPDNIKFHGFIKDPSSIFASCKVAVAPIISGAGIKIKVLDYIASELKVVATSIGAEGIDSDQIAICDDPREFADAVLRAAGL